jgi:plasmid stabilization system protein ParE
MGNRKVTVKRSAAESIAAVAWFIESKGMVATAEKFSDKVYNFLESLSDERKSYALCRDPQRLLLGYKCVSYRK